MEPSSPFRQVTAPPKDASANSAERYPIPPRQKKSPVFRTDTSEYRFEVSVYSPREEFITQAKQLAAKTESKAGFVPFMQYYPTYRGMNSDQQKWYFYWRSCIRKGQLLPTDLSYIFINVYETINVIGFPSAEQAREHLVTLWEGYRTQHPKLDNYLVDWIADLIIVHKLKHSVLEWYAHALKAGMRIYDQDLALEAQFRQSRSLADFPLTVVYQLANYSPIQNKFYTEHNSDGKVERGYKTGLQAVEQLLRKDHGETYLDALAPAPLRTITRFPFQAAIHSYPQTSIAIATVSSRFGSTQLSKYLSGILKYSENVLRKQANFKSKLRGIELPELWAMAIDEAFIAAAPRKTVQIDLDQVEALRRESEAVRSRLTIDADEDLTAGSNDDKQQRDSKQSASPESTQLAFNTTRPESTPDGLLTDLIPIAKIMESHDSITTRLLRCLQKNTWVATSDLLTNDVQGRFLNVEIDNINAIALELLGDYLLLDEQDSWTVAEDYRDEVEHLLNQTILPLSQPAQINPLTESLDYSELSPDWASFAAGLRAEHWETLLVMTTQPQYEARLAEIARTAYTTANRIIDHINEVADNNVGDIIIDTSTDLPFIEPEDIESVKGLLAWAQAKAVMKA